MPINQKSIMQIISNQVDYKHTTAGRIAMEYAELKKKIENPELQSWYFKQSLDSNKQKMKSLKKEFEEWRKEVNEISVDILLEQRKDNETFVKNVLKMERISFIYQIALNAKVSSIAHINEVLKLKGR